MPIYLAKTMLYFISLGLKKEDLSLEAYNTARKCDKLYLESYTSIGASKEELELMFNKKIDIANRDLVEAHFSNIVNEAKTKNIGFLVYGDFLSATTHTALLEQAKNIKFKIIHGISILTVIGETGLSLYRFGKIASIPFENENIETPYEILRDNKELGMHTLFLLDLNPEKNKFLQIKDAIRYLLKIEIRQGKKVINDNTLCIGCARLGQENKKIKVGKAKELLKEDFGVPPYCLIVPGKLQFYEEEAIEQWK